MKKNRIFFLIPNKLALVLCLIVVFFFVACKRKESLEIVRTGIQDPETISIAGLQQRSYISEVHFEKNLAVTDKYTSKLISYVSDGLKIYALVNTPTSKKPLKGFPILLFGHGFHPTPKEYGVSTKTGKNWRPGDYYRGLPEAYAANGFIVITPDYRGHNVSEGFEFTKTSFLASSYYAIDMLHLVSALKSLKNADKDSVFYLGHSLGGDVGLKTILATNQIKGASIWGGVSVSTAARALYYGKLAENKKDKTTGQSIEEYLAVVKKIAFGLGFENDLSAIDAINFIQEINTPIILHHARWETSVPYQWSESLALILFKYQKIFEIYAYNSKEHLLKGENRKHAIQRDIAFFNKIDKDKQK